MNQKPTHEQRIIDIEQESNDVKKSKGADIDLSTPLETGVKGRHEFGADIMSTIEGLIVPSLEKLKKTKLDSVQEFYLSVLETNINDLISPLLCHTVKKMLNLTPSEIHISILIKQGRTTKEIADYLKCSSSTVGYHRHNIRKKLNLENEKVNLRKHLTTLGVVPR